MSPKLKILDVVVRRLKERKSPFLGELYGILRNDYLIILSFVLKYTEEQNESKYQISENNFPTEVDLYGVVNCSQHLQKYEKNLPLDVKNIFQDVVVSDNPVLLNYGYLEKDNNVRAFFYKNGTATECSYDVLEESEIWKLFVVIHLHIPVNFICCNSAKNKEEFMTKFTKKISSGSAMFHIEDSDVYLTSSNADGMCEDQDVGDVLCKEEPALSPLTMYLKNIPESKTPVIIDINTLMKTTCGKLNENSPKRALAIQHVTKNFEGIQGCLRLDSLILFQRDRSEKYLYNALVDSVCRTMRLMKRSFFLHDNIVPEIHHFYPTNLAHFVTLVYPNNVKDDDFTDTRKYVHSKFNLPCDVPLFRRNNVFAFTEKKISVQQLMNVHEGLAPSGVNGTPSIVQGNYLYYHYTHGNTNDSGWGCAYRSLQTLFSWYKLQGWTDRKVPTLTEIQQVLVDIKDKPKTFVGSRQWIGSLEVSFVLDTLINVTCRVLNVQQGESVAEYSHDLANHFKKHGTPVMIGGGVLAHTILGVDINDENDVVKFLVLDPHYTGPDQLSTIQSKGWVGWKNPDFWKQDSFYNLCMPYRKIGV
ncbi:hypothetical protein V9T40_013300 [Parthenolecanium corni]|uniref:Probable Ufm1-specific protease 2 n=1 Tax=Parthenolecanium corni TaxID=536013 RepID=A0AAN9TNH3_9HEMI